MNPGRELDALVAEKAMGLEHVRTQEQGHHTDLVHGPSEMAGVARIVPCYSTSIAAAWEVVERLSQSDDVVICSTSTGWSAQLDINPLPTISYADTAPHAICLAALRAVGVEV